MLLRLLFTDTVSNVVRAPRDVPDVSWDCRTMLDCRSCASQAWCSWKLPTEADAEAVCVSTNALDVRDLRIGQSTQCLCPEKYGCELCKDFSALCGYCPSVHGGGICLMDSEANAKACPGFLEGFSAVRCPADAADAAVAQADSTAAFSKSILVTLIGALSIAGAVAAAWRERSVWHQQGLPLT
jgi:hypothetical protein